MNTRKQINVIVVLVFLSLFATGAYTLWDPERQDTAEEVQLEHTLERAAYLFQNNCRACHGDAGEGGAASNRLRLAPPLNRPDLQGIDPETSEVSILDRGEAYQLVYNTITCGRVGKAMPAWAQRQGGTLNDEQIKQLTILITEGGTNIGTEEEPLTGWDLAYELALEHDEEASAGLHLDEAVTEEDTQFVVSKVDILSAGGRLRIGAEGEEEIMIIQEIDADTRTITVERGFGTTNAGAYEAGAELLTTVAPPDPPAINERACGQIAGAQGPTPTPQPPSTTLSIVAEGIAWNTEVLNGLAGEELTITVESRDTDPHNWAAYDGEDATGDVIIATEIEPGPFTQTATFGPLEVGSYYYQCDVHPQMFGTLNIVEAGAAPADTPPTVPAEDTDVDATDDVDAPEGGTPAPLPTPSP